MRWDFVASVQRWLNIYWHVQANTGWSDGVLKCCNCATCGGLLSAEQVGKGLKQTDVFTHVWVANLYEVILQNSHFLKARADPSCDLLAGKGAYSAFTAAFQLPLPRCCVHAVDWGLLVVESSVKVFSVQVFIKKVESYYYCYFFFFFQFQQKPGNLWPEWENGGT